MKTVASVEWHAANEPQLSTKASSRKSPRSLLFVVLAVAVLVGVGVYALTSQKTEGDTGSYVISQGGMTDEEAQSLVDAQAEKSRITVSMSPTPQLRGDGELRVNFVVSEPNNGYSERIEVEQGGTIVYRSGVVKPGYRIEWAHAPMAVEGHAVATVYAVNEDGRDTGNPISVEVDIVAADDYPQQGDARSEATH